MQGAGGEGRWRAVLIVWWGRMVMWMEVWSGLLEEAAATGITHQKQENQSTVAPLTLQPPPPTVTPPYVGHPPVMTAFTNLAPSRLAPSSTTRSITALVMSAPAHVGGSGDGVDGGGGGGSVQQLVGIRRRAQQWKTAIAEGAAGECCSQPPSHPPLRFDL